MKPAAPLRLLTSLFCAAAIAGCTGQAIGTGTDDVTGAPDDGKAPPAAPSASTGPGTAPSPPPTTPALGGEVQITVNGERGKATAVSAKVGTQGDTLGYLLKIEFTTGASPGTHQIEVFVTRKGELCFGVMYTMPGGSRFMQGDPEGLDTSCDGYVSKLPDAKDDHLVGSFSGTLYRYYTKTTLTLAFDVPSTK
jgi:hypothetical protein